MSLITVRNPIEAHAETVVAGEALEVGMVVKLVQGAAKGSPCKVMKAVQADLADDTVICGIVDYVQDDDLTVDFLIDPTNRALTLNTGADNSYVIPLGAQCVMWMNKPIIGFHPSALDASIVMATVREPTALSFSATSSKLAVIDVTNVNTIGVVLQHEGAELTVLLHKL